MEQTVREGAADARLYGWVIGVASVLAVGAMMAHPSIGGPDMRTALQEIERESWLAAAVHGFLMGTTAALLFGFHGFSRRLGHRPLAEAGLVAWAIGTFAMFGAMIASGFVVSRVAAGYGEASPADLEVVRGLFRLVGAYNQAWAVVGTAALSAGILFWSLALLREAGVPRWIGWMGVVAGAVAAVAVGSGALTLDVHGMLVVVAAQTLWSVAVAAQLIRGKLQREREE